MKRSPIRNHKGKRATTADKSRAEFKASMPPTCMGCGRTYEYAQLSVHEMLAGSYRLQCAMEPAGLLLLAEPCGCHKRFQYAPLAEQMAHKKVYDEWFYEPWKVYLMKHPESKLSEYVEFLGDVDEIVAKVAAESEATDA